MHACARVCATLQSLHPSSRGSADTCTSRVGKGACHQHRAAPPLSKPCTHEPKFCMQAGREAGSEVGSAGSACSSFTGGGRPRSQLTTRAQGVWEAGSEVGSAGGAHSSFTGGGSVRGSSSHASASGGLFRWAVCLWRRGDRDCVGLQQPCQCCGGDSPGLCVCARVSAAHACLCWGGGGCEPAEST